MGVVPPPLSCGAIPARRDGLHFPASSVYPLHSLNPSTFLTTFSTFPLSLIGIPVAQALDQQTMGTKPGKEVTKTEMP